MPEIILLRRAVSDITDIELNSINKWGKQVADNYLDSIDEALQMLSEHPHLLRRFAQSEHLFYYSIREHNMFCTKYDDAIYILTLLYGSMDLEHIVSKLEPTLVEEVAVMHQRLRNS